MIFDQPIGIVGFYRQKCFDCEREGEGVVIATRGTRAFLCWRHFRAAMKAMHAAGLVRPRVRERCECCLPRTCGCPCDRPQRSETGTWCESSDVTQGGTRTISQSSNS